MRRDLDFAGLIASLRSPRVAVVIPANNWTTHARRALQFFTGTWGGASGVVVPMSGGQVKPALHRILERYDPDYLVPIQMSLSDVELLHPGAVELRDPNRRRVVSPGRRAKFIAEIEAHGMTMMGPAIADEHLEALEKGLHCFRVPDFRRVHGVHPGEEPPGPLSPVEVPAEFQVAYETGDERIDLAIAMQQGAPFRPAETRTLADGSFTHFDAASMLTKNTTFDAPKPFEATKAGLTTINHGFFREPETLVVLGRTADDFALAMLWDRTVGTGIWLPLTSSHTRWHSHIGVDLDRIRLRGDEKVRVTSMSMDEARCQDLMRRMRAARWIRDPNNTTEPWSYVHPQHLQVGGRIDLRLTDKWDNRVTVPVAQAHDGGVEMAATFPLLAPEAPLEGVRGWIIDAEWPEHPIHSHAALGQVDVIASTQNPHETFVRPSGTGIAFESGRWDFVHAGASQFGSLAQPKLRWPGLLNALKIAAASRGFEVQPSHAGKVGRIVSELWGGRADLGADLSGVTRSLMKAFTTRRKNNGPIEGDPDVPDTDKRLVMAGNCLVPFGALTRMFGGEVSSDEIRSWLDRRVSTGAIRMGLALECSVCPWHDFYRVDDVGTRFTCKRCGAENTLTQQTWRSPAEAPLWYYSLHPTVTEFLATNGDVPILAVNRFAQTQRAWDSEFELEVIKTGKSRPAMEIDFATMSREGLVLGEAKSVGKLDGRDATERVRDARKLLDAAKILGAREVCFASMASWNHQATEGIAHAVMSSGSQVTVSVLENLGTSAPSTRKILHNPAGP